jgi:cytochrome bd-type quinol oxidase subunit 2
MKKFLLSYKGVAIMTVIALIARFGVPMITKGDTENKIVKVSDVKRSGYEITPGYVLINASWSKAYKDAKKNPFHNAMNILSVIAAIAGAFIWFKWADGRDGKGGAVWGTLIAFYILVLVPHYIVPSHNKNSDAYTKKICLKEFVEGKNYDYLFPETDEQKISLEQFENSCR